VLSVEVWEWGVAMKRRHREKSVGRKPMNVFEAMLEQWRRGDELTWGELFAAWLRLPVAPKSRETVRRVIRRVEWIH